MDPPEAWANIDDCGNWPCTAPQNVLMSFENTEFVDAPGILFNTKEKDFQIVSNNATAYNNIPGC
jgi:hypothetical protein